MAPIIAPLQEFFEEVVVWDNSDTPELRDLKVYGRYEAIEDTVNDVVYVQDDDVIAHEESLKTLCEYYQPGYITANMPERFRAHYSDSCLVGFGSLFDYYLPQQAFDRFGDRIERDAFLRCCDVVFTGLTPFTWVDVPYTEMAYASAENRMYRQAIHVPERATMLELVRGCRAGN